MTSPSRRRPLALVVASVVASVALVSAGRAIWGPSQASSTPFAGPAGTAAAAGRFLDAWRHSLSTSWSLEAIVRRTTRAGGSLTFAVHRAQRPPDRLEVGLGAVSARFAGRRVACATDTTRTLNCRTVDETMTYQHDVDTQLSTLRPYVAGRVPLYAVAQIGGCFELTLRFGRFPAPPYGRQAVFCFDPSSGAPAGSVVIRDEGTDRTTVTESHAPATPADVALPAASEVTAGLPS